MVDKKAGQQSRTHTNTRNCLAVILSIGSAFVDTKRYTYAQIDRYLCIKLYYTRLKRKAHTTALGSSMWCIFHTSQSSSSSSSAHIHAMYQLIWWNGEWIWSLLVNTHSSKSIHTNTKLSNTNKPPSLPNRVQLRFVPSNQIALCVSNVGINL